MLARMVLISRPHDPPASASQSAGITESCCVTRLECNRVISAHRNPLFPVAGTQVVMLVHLQLTSCFVAWFLTGYRPIWKPRFKDDTGGNAGHQAKASYHAGLFLKKNCGLGRRHAAWKLNRENRYPDPTVFTAHRAPVGG
ncbi:hypothetical protein AAY473_023835 [Plecturocebus cupreus]